MANMTKQEEIRGEIISRLRDHVGSEMAIFLTDKILEDEASQGVVIKAHNSPHNPYVIPLVEE